MARHNAAVGRRLFDDRRAKLKTIKVPAVVVHGSLDPFMPVEGGKDTAANIPGAELRIIPGMGHDLPIPLIKTIADAITAAATARPRQSPEVSASATRPHDALRRTRISRDFPDIRVSRGLSSIT